MSDKSSGAKMGDSSKILIGIKAKETDVQPILVPVTNKILAVSQVEKMFPGATMLTYKGPNNLNVSVEFTDKDQKYMIIDENVECYFAFFPASVTSSACNNIATARKRLKDQLLMDIGCAKKKLSMDSDASGSDENIELQNKKKFSRRVLETFWRHRNLPSDKFVAQHKDIKKIILNGNINYKLKDIEKILVEEFKTDSNKFLFNHSSIQLGLPNNVIIKQFENNCGKPCSYWDYSKENKRKKSPFNINLLTTLDQSQVNTNSNIQDNTHRSKQQESNSSTNNIRTPTATTSRNSNFLQLNNSEASRSSLNFTTSESMLKNPDVKQTPKQDSRQSGNSTRQTSSECNAEKSSSLSYLLAKYPQSPVLKSLSNNSLPTHENTHEKQKRKEDSWKNLPSGESKRRRVSEGLNTRQDTEYSKFQPSEPAMKSPKMASTIAKSNAEKSSNLSYLLGKYPQSSVLKTLSNKDSTEESPLYSLPTHEKQKRKEDSLKNLQIDKLTYESCQDKERVSKALNTKQNAEYSKVQPHKSRTSSPKIASNILKFNAEKPLSLVSKDVSDHKDCMEESLSNSCKKQEQKEDSWKNLPSCKSINNSCQGEKIISEALKVITPKYPQVPNANEMNICSNIPSQSVELPYENERNICTNTFLKEKLSVQPMALPEDPIIYAAKKEIKSLGINVTIINKNQLQVYYNEKLGKGAQGSVFKGSWAGTPVAIKVITKQQKFQMLLFREISVMEQLRHPNFVNIMGLVIEPNNYLIVMEFCDGPNLHALILAHDKDKWKSLLRKHKHSIGYQLCKAINFIHSQNNEIIHRDIKPLNIMVNLNGVVKVCDLGLAKWKNTQKSLDTCTEGTIRGTFTYMPPEIILNKSENLTTKVDVWAVACTLFEMYNGKKCWETNNFDDWRGMKYNFLCNKKPNLKKIPAELQEIIGQCFEYEPKKRPSIQKVLEAYSKMMINK